MHRIKSKARHHAWYHRPGEPSSHKYNPFVKTRTPSSRHAGGDLEAGLGKSHTENCLDEINGARTPAAGDDAHVQDVNRASTMPVSRSGPMEMSKATETASPEQRESGTRAADAVSSGPEAKHTIRDRFAGKFKRHGKGSDAEGREDVVAGTPKKAAPHFTFANQIRATLFNSWINLLLIAVPVGIIINYLHVNPVAIFIVNFIAIVPLAALLSYATEEIALRVGETLGGLLNATFGNAVELIVSVIALLKNEIIIVQTSLIGSILSNLLLVMGMSFFFGGLTRVEQFFNTTVAQTASSLLALGIGSLIIPTAFHAFSSGRSSPIVTSGTSIILLLVYICFLIFQLKSHIHMYNTPSPKAEKRGKAKGEPEKAPAQMDAGMAGAMGGRPPVQDDDEGAEEPQLSLWTAIILLAVSTVFVALCAEFMVSSIDALTENGKVSKTFVGLILLPIVGNAAEHATAVTVACKDKMDLAIGVAIGSSMQIALLVIPLIVTLGWILGKAAMNLYFDGFQVAALFITVLLVNYIVQDGKSHWLEGVMLMSTYIIIAIAAVFYPNHEDVAS
ncbi:MAG: hypothetical protein M1816_000695 [Peltula sp. TS41687]|nr:MAG: hypothetical protein M1816_000695 [Peltula sp. TS41687]